MITKFHTLEEETSNSIEFGIQGKYLRIKTNRNDNPETFLDVLIDEQDLFELIGQLLRIQSKLKRNGGK
jgi:hypothetical protein|tara:strand:+ start:58 stop:264 length:207 start_codon:yes stop_codon:yes gene_type:complete